MNSLAFNPEGNIIATGQVNIIKLWDLKTGKELDTLWGHAIDVNSLAFTPDGQFLVAGCSQGEIKIWDWQNRSPLRTINPAGNLLGSIVSLFNPNGMLWSVAISPDAQIIASGGSNRAIALWNFHTGEVIRTLTQHLSDVHCVAFSPNGQIFASGSQDKTIRIWNIHTGDLLYTFEHLGEVNCVALSPDGKTLVSADNARIIKVWGVSN
ncbi:WD40 repeat domain-containing protein [Mastigocladopsis repens]|uniref:WD40 repeat domain-containing protein n=1 Tax=Mastigocladopsis repens TaxID=221287 RepID=UPI0002E9335F|nr:WD40 repeat domain-containing protein [Mastigocladopsis repens]